MVPSHDKMISEGMELSAVQGLGQGILVFPITIDFQSVTNVFSVRR
jgi:hypothetical protein